MRISTYAVYVKSTATGKELPALTVQALSDTSARSRVENELEKRGNKYIVIEVRRIRQGK